MVKDKDASIILNLLPKSANYYFVQPDIPRALPVGDLLKAANQSGLNGQGYDWLWMAFEQLKYVQNQMI